MEWTERPAAIRGVRAAIFFLLRMIVASMKFFCVKSRAICSS